jgi:hypothetical protein
VACQRKLCLETQYPRPVPCRITRAIICGYASERRSPPSLMSIGTVYVKTLEQVGTAPLCRPA